MKWPNNLAFRFWLAINSLVLTGVLTISGLYFYRESSHLEDRLRNEGITAANTLNSAIGLYMLEEDYSKISPLTYSIQSEPNIAYIVVRDKEGLTINQKGDALTNPDQLLVEKIPLEYFQEVVGEVEIGLKTTALEQQQIILFKDTIVTGIIYSLLSLIISYLVSRKQTAPINRLIAATKKLTNGDRNVEVLENMGAIEVQLLATEFNKMASTIQNHENILVEEIKKATKDLSEKVEILEILGDISNSVLEDDIQSIEVMKSTLINIKKYIQVSQVSFAFINSNKKVEVFKLNKNNNIELFNLRNSDSTLNEAIEGHKIIVRHHLYQNDSSPYEQKLMNEGMSSLLILPIIAKSKVIGTLNLASELPDYFSKEIITKLDVFTNQIALALDRVAAYESLQKSAYHDYLTGLPNYRLFKICIQEALDKAKEKDTLLAVMFLDLDRFKIVNDTFGHATGDLLLKYISKQIQSCVSPEDTVSRIGGDEFSVLLPSITEPEDAIEMAQKIMKVLENPVIIKGYKIPITTSIGISFYPEDGSDADSLLKLADRAMYRVKKHGKNNFAIYSSNEDDHLANQIVIENDLRKAINQNEFVVYYQPKINIQSGTLSGVEALVRWLHPAKGLVPPCQFIPQAEETGLIIPIGEFVLREACRQSVNWQSIGLPAIPVSVNLSTQQFLQPTLVSTVEKVIKETNIQPELLELEITESMTMDLERSIGILKELKNLGIRISVDDFGTGYSSLNYLRQLPIDRVKIDKSFINEMTSNSSNEAIVDTIINMAHNLKLSVTAEGAETSEQVQLLQQHHCDEVQGYYFSKPITAEQLEQEYLTIIHNAQKAFLLCV